MKNLRSLTIILAVSLLTASGCGQQPASLESSSSNLQVLSGNITHLADSASNSLENEAALDEKMDLDSQNQEHSLSSTVSDSQNALLNPPKSVHNALPALSLSTNEIPLGEVMVLTLQNVSGRNISAQTTFGFTPQFFAEGDVYKALVPISYNLTPGTYTLTVQADSKTFQETIEITARQFVEQHLTIDNTIASTTNTVEANMEWERKIEPLKLVSDDAHYWDGTFLQPVQGQITTEYGSVRYTNGAISSSRHSGIDIAAREGTPVLAAGNGRVLFAGYLQLTGNTIVIEHGMGLKSFYYHMQKTNVEAEDQVKQGDVIGAVGTTGYSTGPHLHFAMTVNQVFINPWTRFDTPIE